MRIIQKKQLLFLITCIFIFVVIDNSYSQTDIPPKPSFILPVIDSTNTLSSYEKKALYDKLKVYNDTTSTEILVMIKNSTYGEDIAMYAINLGHKWEIGGKGKDNGVVVLVAKEDRKLWIATGYGVEHLLTDALSKRIVEQIITPQFKQGNYYEGLDRATSAIMQILNGEYKGTPQGDGGGGIPVVFIIIFVIVLLIILSGRNKRNGGNGGNKRNGATQSILEAIILSRAGRGGFGGGGFGGGSSGGGFGGGGFGGGGAGGSW